MSALHVLFRVGEADYVLPASEVVEMESFTQATPVPGSAPYVAGLVQIRGKVIPVVDLRARFGLAPIARSLDSRVIVVRDGERLVGLLADSAREVMKIDTQDFHPPPEAVAQQAAGFVSLVAQAGPRLLMRIDFSKVIGEPGTSKEQRHGQQA
ncbi:MAG: chemotaxis protein CheW [Myxococcaceae bacterium]